MARKSRGRIQPAMNVTPLVDVVLVLLIIFMVITPLLSKQLWLHVPPQETSNTAPANPNDQPLVLHLGKDGAIDLNGNPVELAVLDEKLRRVFAARNDHVLFLDADDNAPYGRTVEALDKSRAGGAITIAILTERPKNAQ